MFLCVFTATHVCNIVTVMINHFDSSFFIFTLMNIHTYFYTGGHWRTYIILIWLSLCFTFRWLPGRGAILKPGINKTVQWLCKRSCLMPVWALRSNPRFGPYCEHRNHELVPQIATDLQVQWELEAHPPKYCSYWSRGWFAWLPFRLAWEDPLCLDTCCSRSDDPPHFLIDRIIAFSQLFIFRKPT